MPIFLEYSNSCYAVVLISQNPTLILNDFAERSKILLNTDLLNHQNNFVEILKTMSSAAKNFDILATSLSVPHNYLYGSTKLLSRSVFS